MTSPDNTPNETRNDMPNDMPHGTFREGTGDPAERDVILSRIIDGRATAAEWAAFRGWSQTDETVWGDLQHMQHDHEHLVQAVDDCLAGIDDVGLPSLERAGAGTETRSGSIPGVLGMTDSLGTPGMTGMMGLDRSDPVAHPEPGASGFWRFAGWAAAACIALAWVGLGGDQIGSIDRTAGTVGGASTSTLNPVANPVGNQIAEGASGASPDQMGDGVWSQDPSRALDYYMAAGKRNGYVVGELPDRPLVQSRRLPDGQVEMLWVRQILERSVVPETFRTTRDEFGNQIAVPVQIQTIGQRLPPT